MRSFISTESGDMAFSAGEVLTNVIQPFWALPLLGATGTEMRTIMGY